MAAIESNGLEPEKCLTRLRDLDSQREDLIRRQAAMGERHESAQRELTRIVEQMKAFGTSPQTIQADMAKSSDELKKATAEYEASLTQLKNQLDEADKALLTLDQNRGEFMSIKVKPSELKLATKLAAQVRDVSAGGSKRYPWLNLYRIVAGDGGMALYANDGFTWLTWYLQLEEPTADVYDIVLSSPKFNEIASKSGEGVSYEITRENNQFVMTQGSRLLRLREEAPTKYTQPKENPNSTFEDQIFSVEAAVLAKNLKFAAPFLDANHATVAVSLGTWTTTGMIVGGWNRQQVRIEGMPCPPMDMSFKQKTMKSMVAFLNALEGDVHITLSGGLYIFECPTRHHRLIVSAESVKHPMSFQELEGQVSGIIRFDGKTLLNGVSLLNTLLPAEADRLSVTITGLREDAVMRVTTLGDESEKSRDEFPIIREGEDEDDINFVVNCRVFESCLSEVSGVILEGRCYLGLKRSRFCIEDERSTETDTYRGVLVPVTTPGAVEEEEDETAAEKPEKEKKKPVKKPTLLKK